MKNSDDLRKIIRNVLNEESGYYPPGTEHDSSAPWNQNNDYVIPEKPKNEALQELKDTYDQSVNKLILAYTK